MEIQKPQKQDSTNKKEKEKVQEEEKDQSVPGSGEENNSRERNQETLPKIEEEKIEKIELRNRKERSEEQKIRGDKRLMDDNPVPLQSNTQRRRSQRNQLNQNIENQPQQDNQERPQVNLLLMDPLPPNRPEMIGVNPIENMNGGEIQVERPNDPRPRLERIRNNQNQANEVIEQINNEIVPPIAAPVLVAPPNVEEGHALQQEARRERHRRRENRRNHEGRRMERGRANHQQRRLEQQRRTSQTEATQSMKLFGAQNMTIYNVLLKRMNYLNSKEAISFSVNLNKSSTVQFKPGEGLYSLSLNFQNPNYKDQEELERKGNYDLLDEDFLSQDQLNYFQKPSRFSHKNSIGITYDCVNNKKHRGDAAIQDILNINNEPRINQHMFDEIQDKYNKTFIIVKNSVSNYTVNFDKIVGLTNIPQYKPSMMQKAFNNISMISTSRTKIYPYQDVISLQFYHSVFFGKNSNISGQIATKFRTSHILNGDFQKIIDRNAYVMRMNYFENLGGFQKASTIFNAKSSFKKMSLENQVYYNFNRTFQLPVVAGFYMKNNIGPQFQVGSPLQSQVSFMYDSFTQQSSSIIDPGNFKTYSPQINSNPFTCILNLANYNDGSILNEINLKIKNQQIYSDIKFCQQKGTMKWRPSFEINWGGNLICSLYEKYYKNQDKFSNKLQTQILASLQPQMQRIGLIHRFKLYDCLDITLGGSLNSTPIDKKFSQNNENQQTIFSNYVLELSLKI